MTLRDRCVLVLAAEPSSTAAEVAAELGADPLAVSKQLHRLVAVHRLAERRAHPRRGCRPTHTYWLTDAGIALAESLSPESAFGAT